jgi:hypothetical protein
MTGLEPATFGITIRCSNQLSYKLQIEKKMCGGAGIRTPGTLSSTSVFKTDAINRSATPPFFQMSNALICACGCKSSLICKTTKFLAYNFLNKFKKTKNNFYKREDTEGSLIFISKSKTSVLISNSLIINTLVNQST